MVTPPIPAPDAEAAPMDAQEDSSASTASLPIDFCGEMPPKEGDTIQVKVVSVDEENGSFDVVCVKKPVEPARGIKAAVAASAPMEET